MPVAYSGHALGNREQAVLDRHDLRQKPHEIAAALSLSERTVRNVIARYNGAQDEQRRWERNAVAASRAHLAALLRTGRRFAVRHPAAKRQI